MRQYLGDAAALARKDLLLELRARDTVPAMLLFVLAILVVFHFALPGGSSRLAELGLLWVAIVFTALLGLGRSFVAEREQGLLDALVLAPCDRSAIWLAKGIATFAFLGAAELVALPAFALFLAGIDGSTVAASIPEKNSAKAGSATTSAATRKATVAIAFASQIALRSQGASRRPSRSRCSRSATNARVSPSSAVKTSATQSRPFAARSELWDGSAKWNVTNAAITNRSIAGTVSRARSSSRRSLRARTSTSCR